KEAPNQGKGNDFRFLLSGLTPDSDWVYQVDTENGEGDLIPFRTASVGKAFSFAVFGDSRPNDGDQPPEDFGRVVAAMAKKSPVFAVGVGDNVQLTPGGAFSISDKLVRGRYDAYLRALNPVGRNVPIFMAVGNHDRTSDPTALKGFNEAFVLPQNGTSTYYSWDYSNLHLVVLDTEKSTGKVDLGTAQLSWLASDLASSKQPIKLVFFHRPFFGGAHSNDFEHSNQAQRAELIALFKKNGVSAVFCGHDHYYRHLKAEGIDWTVTGGAGAPESNSAPVGGFVGPHFLMVNVDPSKGISAKVYSDAGVEKDSW
ncbi:MAG TPA: metallophosphoesterase, partial [Chroococcales cyanobacterium]